MKCRRGVLVSKTSPHGRESAVSMRASSATPTKKHSSQVEMQTGFSLQSPPCSVRSHVPCCHRTLHPVRSGCSTICTQRPGFAACALRGSDHHASAWPTHLASVCPKRKRYLDAGRAWTLARTKFPCQQFRDMPLNSASARRRRPRHLHPQPVRREHRWCVLEASCHLPTARGPRAAAPDSGTRAALCREHRSKSRQNAAVRPDYELLPRSSAHQCWQARLLGLFARKVTSNGRFESLGSAASRAVSMQRSAGRQAEAKKPLPYQAPRTAVQSWLTKQRLCQQPENEAVVAYSAGNGGCSTLTGLVWHAWRFRWHAGVDTHNRGAPSGGLVWHESFTLVLARAVAAFGCLGKYAPQAGARPGLWLSRLADRRFSIKIRSNLTDPQSACARARACLGT